MSKPFPEEVMKYFAEPGHVPFNYVESPDDIVHLAAFMNQVMDTSREQAGLFMQRLVKRFAPLVGGQFFDQRHRRRYDLVSLEYQNGSVRIVKRFLAPVAGGRLHEYHVDRLGDIFGDPDAYTLLLIKEYDEGLKEPPYMQVLDHRGIVELLAKQFEDTRFFREAFLILRHIIGDVPGLKTTLLVNLHARLRSFLHRPRDVCGAQCSLWSGYSPTTVHAHSAFDLVDVKRNFVRLYFNESIGPYLWKTIELADRYNQRLAFVSGSIKSHDAVGRFFGQTDTNLVLIIFGFAGLVEPDHAKYAIKRRRRQREEAALCAGDSHDHRAAKRARGASQPRDLRRSGAVSLAQAIMGHCTETLS